ncbi:MAG: SPASM domain-containing protein [Candidatus Pacebacteria bacterium]|nr:SPASM domain-containing protein [Candidatus Paceibacterota bacterium]
MPVGRDVVIQPVVAVSKNSINLREKKILSLLKLLATMENKKFKLSKWCHFFIIKNDAVAVFHSLSMFVAFFDVNKGNKLKALKTVKHFKKTHISFLDEEDLSLLLDENLIVSSSFDELQQIYDLRENLLKNLRLDLMHLLLTDSCNMKCLYCFEDSPSKPKNFSETMMSEKTASQSIDFFSSLTKRYGSIDGDKVIHLYGGEPLLNFSALKSAVLRTEELKGSGVLSKKTNLVLITNGLLLTEEKADFLAENKVSIGLSIDGPKHLNDIYRISKDGNEVFSRIIKAYKIINERNINVGLSVTLTPDVVNNFSEVLDFLINDLKIKDGLTFNILHYNPKVPTSDDYFEKSADCIIRAFKVFRELNIYEERMMRKVKSFVNQEPMFADCGVVGNQIVIAPNGQVGVCQDFVKPKTYFGKFINDFGYNPVKDGLFDEWRKRSPLFMEECFDCEAVAICGGGCPASVELKTGDRWNIDKRICPHSKKTLNWLVLESFQNVDF